MKDVITDCINYGVCGTVVSTGKCSKACIERYNKEMGKKPKTNADRIRAMTDEELEAFLIDLDLGYTGSPFITDWGKWLQQPAEGD